MIRQITIFKKPVIHTIIIKRFECLPGINALFYLVEYFSPDCEIQFNCINRYILSNISRSFFVEKGLIII